MWDAVYEVISKNAHTQQMLVDNGSGLSMTTKGKSSVPLGLVFY